MPLALILSTSASTRLMVGMLSRAAPHQHDALDDVVDARRSPAMPSRGRLPTLTVGHVADHRPARPGCCAHQGAADLVGRMDQADAAHHGGLRAEIHRLAADIDVGVAERLQHLRHRQAVAHAACADRWRCRRSWSCRPSR